MTNTVFAPLFEKGTIDILRLAPPAGIKNASYYHVAINRKDFMALLSHIRTYCRQESLSFRLHNTSHSIKNLSFFSRSFDDVLECRISLVGTLKKRLSKERMKTAAGKLTTPSLINKIRHFRLPRSHFTCLIGPDGVGKSTVADFINDISPSRRFRYKSVYRKSFAYKLFYFCQNKHKDKNSYDDVHPNIIFFTSLLRLYTKSVLSLFSKKNILSDRYTNDHLAHHLRSIDAPRVSSWFGLKTRITPAPKNIIQLDAPASVITARRDELSAQTINFLSDFYLNSAVRIQPDNYIYLNTHISLTETQHLLQKMLISPITKR